MSVREDIHRIAGRSAIPFGGRPFVSYLFLKCLLIVSVCVAPLSTAAEQPSLPDGVEIRIQANPQTAAIGDRIQIDLDITTPVGWQIETLEPEQQMDDFFILEYMPGPDVEDTDKYGKKAPPDVEADALLQKHRSRIVAAIYKTGTFTFPGIRVFLTDFEGKKAEFESPSIEIEIESILIGDNQDLRDLKKQAEIQEKIRWLFWTLILISALILGTAVWIIRRKYRKRPDSMPVIPEQNPFDLAESDLRDLISRKLPENSHTKRYYVLLSEIVKRILEAAYEIHTAEQTTLEIMGSLQCSNSLKKDHLSTIESLLIQCDMVKFAKYIPSGTENSSAAESAFRILSEARKAVGSG